MWSASLPAEHDATTPAPMRMEAHDVNNARGRVPARVYLLGQNGTVWKAFALEMEQG